MRAALALLATFSLLVALPAHGKPGGKLDVASLERFAKETLAGFDRLELVPPTLDPHLVLFVADDAGTPLALRGAEGGADFRARLAAWKADGWVLDTDVTELACQVGKGLGVCTARYHQGFTLQGAPNGEAWIRGTLVAAEHGGRWHLVHLHESPDARPAAEPTPAPQEAAE